MLADVVKIGDSKGIRIPADLLKECQIADKVEMKIQDEKIIIVPIIAPLTSTSKKHPPRIEIFPAGKTSRIILDEIRYYVDKSKLEKKIGVLEGGYIAEVKNIIREMPVD